MTGPVKVLQRMLAVAGVEIVEVLRRPRALLGVALGPLVVLAVFGVGFRGPGPLRAAVVVPPDLGLPGSTAAYRGMAPGLDVVSVSGETAPALQALAAGRVDLVVAAQNDARQRLDSGQQAVVTVDYDTSDPYLASQAKIAASQLAAAINHRLVESAVQAARQRTLTAGGSWPAELRPALLASPVRVDAKNIAPTAPSIQSFYGLAVIAIALQHLGITLAALSLLRDRQRGMLELFRVAPIHAIEVLLGKALALGALSCVVAAGMFEVLVAGFGVPLPGSVVPVAAVTGLLVATALGLGFLVALTSRAERQAVQLALLILLASVFFGGLAVDLTELSPPVRALAQLLPVTQATVLFQDLFLRGRSSQAWRGVALALMAASLFLADWWLLRRELRATRA